MNQNLSTADLYQLFEQHPYITIDSRNIRPGCIFFAIKGDSFDGNSFAADSLEKGAAYAIIDNPDYATNNTFMVSCVLETLQELARLHRSTLNIPVIGITGTNGKTTTKELVNAVLSSNYKVLATSGNLNNHIGVPITLLSITKNTEIAIIEMGANHPGEIAFLCDIAKPTHGLITNIGKAHLEGFGGYEGVIRTKSELYHFLRKTGGTAFVNGDNELLTSLSEGINRITYGIGGSASTCVNLVESDPFLQISWNNEGVETCIKTQLVGDYNLENVAAALCIAGSFRVPEDKAIEAISGYVPSNNRSQQVKTKDNTVILDAYNANPSSMLAALINFANLKAEKKMLILGDMLELGEESSNEHLALLEMAKKQGFTNVILVGPEFQKVSGSGQASFPTILALVDWLKKNPIHDFFILVKGSRGIKMEKVMEVL
jgi:UDP-N-acetylmuramoyl-tripeptide--D-alanyl-D-alanine ligase